MRLSRQRVIGPAVAQDGEQDEPLDEQEDDGRDGEDEAVDALGVVALDRDR